MDSFEHTFDWVPAAEGRARFAGGIRGWDEQGHETYAVDLDGKTLYGEIARVFLPNQNDFNIQVISSGYGVREHVGMPRRKHHASDARDDGLSAKDQQRIQLLLAQLIQAALHFQDRPGVLREYPHARFQGKLLFVKDWAAGAPAHEVTVGAATAPT
ncbi:hypothetical protein [Achromobacter insuavis]|uniref:hypothetical protein n=1 Tax=Achromobacter insuavis TaxID=1287735 RepID=UPI001F137748|nr:hypothetical protein [Achromobacter insuavis]